jgi:hypothetical protein
MFILFKGSVKGRLMVHLSLGWFIKAVRNGHIKRVTDEDIQSSVLEIMGVNVNTSYVTCPTNRRHVLAIKLPFLVMIIKNMKKFFSFEVEVLDDKNMRRRFRASNYQVWIKCMLFQTIYYCGNHAKFLNLTCCYANFAIDHTHQYLFSTS